MQGTGGKAEGLEAASSERVRSSRIFLGVAVSFCFVLLGAVLSRSFFGVAASFFLVENQACGPERASLSGGSINLSMSNTSSHRIWLFGKAQRHIL